MGPMKRPHSPPLPHMRKVSKHFITSEDILLEWAAKGETRRVEEWLKQESNDVIAARDDGGRNLLSIATIHGHKDLVGLLLKSCPNLLEALSSRGLPALGYAVEAGHKAIVDMLLKGGANAKFINK